MRQVKRSSAFPNTKVLNLQNLTVERQKAYTIEHSYAPLTETQPLKKKIQVVGHHTAKHKYPQKLLTSKHVNIFHGNPSSYI